MYVLAGCLMIAFGVSLIVTGARHKSAAGKLRAFLIAGGSSVFLAGLLVVMMGSPRTGMPAWLPGGVIGSVAVGTLVGWWLGHVSRRPTH